MRKRRAIALFGGFSVLLLAYIAWCVSPFFREPSFYFSKDVPPEAQTFIRKWRPYHTLPPSGKLMREIMNYFANPYAVKRIEVRAWSYDESGIALTSSLFETIAERKNDKWALGSYVQITSRY